MFRVVPLAGLAEVGAMTSIPVLADGTLILAPHPDDDVITAARAAVRAWRAGENVTVVYVINGDLNGGTASGTGTTRQNEAVRAQVDYVQASENDLIFLGYPTADCGPFTRHTRPPLRCLDVSM